MMDEIKKRIEVLSVEIMRDTETLNRLSTQVTMKKGAVAELNTILRSLEVGINEKPTVPVKSKAIPKKGAKK